VAFGLFVEGVYHRQSFDTTRVSPARQALGASFGGILSVERHVGAGFALRLEGGPVTGLFARGVVRNGVEVDRELATPLTWWGAGGLVWRW
jgi:hypothetical protein